MHIQTLKNTLFAFLFLVAGNISLSAQDLIYTPRSSAFGGNALNYSWMLNSATAQNTFTEDPDQDDEGNLFLDDFSQTLERQLISFITRELFEAQFDPDRGLEEGTYQFGNFLVDVAPGVDGLIISVNDFSTGGTTQITVPFF